MLGGLYTKIMYHNVNVVTEETLGTGGSYPDTTLEGLGLVWVTNMILMLWAECL